MSGDFTFLKGNIETIILCSLYNGDKYGYEIAKEIKECTENQYEIKQPTLYSYLKRLEAQELIYSYWGAESNGGRRRYYKLTEDGRFNCEKFMAEWKYHQTVMSNLVDDTNVEMASQDEVTPLFGSKQKKTRRNRILDKLTEQDLIAERLNALTNKDSSDIKQTESTADKERQETQTAATVVAEPAVVEVAQPAEETVDTASLQQKEDEERQQRLKQFEVRQDNADEFMQRFDLKAQELSMREPDAGANGENYQHVLMNVLGDQLDGMRDFNQQQTEKQNIQFANDHPLALEDIADSLAKQGIRMRIYNRAASNFRSLELIPLKKITFLTSWISFAFLFVALGAMCISTLSTNTWGFYAIWIAIGLICPVVTSFMYIAGPAREPRPKFNFGRTMAYISGLAVILLTVLLAIVFGLDLIKLNNMPVVLAGIIAPTILLAMFPIAVVIFNQLFKRYSN